MVELLRILVIWIKVYVDGCKVYGERLESSGIGDFVINVIIVWLLILYCNINLGCVYIIKVMKDI